MALPTLSAHGPMRAHILARQMVRHRELEARRRQQWDLNSQYFREQNVRGHQQAVWSSTQSYEKSMSAYHQARQREEKRMSLEQRRSRLRAMLKAERDQLEAELREIKPDRSALASGLKKKTEDLRSAREDRRKKLAQELLKEHWRRNSPELRKVESALHRDHVISQWQEQVCEKKKHDAEEQEKNRRFESEFEKVRVEALQKMEKVEEEKKEDDRKRAEELCSQMEELKLREEEANRLKREQGALLAQQWELELMEEERRKAEEKINKSRMGQFLVRQYRAQLKRRAQQVQEELEMDRKILAALMEVEDTDGWLENARKERAVANAAWMKVVIEEQLQLEREREAQFEILYREEAQRVWEQREAEWAKERRARERLMHEVLEGRQKQLELNMQQNRKAQEESLKRREELIQKMELEKESRRQEKQRQESLRKARMQEINDQVEQRRRERWADQRRKEREDEEELEALQVLEDELRQETQRMAKQGYREKIHSGPRSAWI